MSLERPNYGDYTEMDMDKQEFKAHGKFIMSEFESYNYIVQPRTIPIFDYTHGNAGVERKTVTDFISSYMSEDEHMWDQSNRMLDIADEWRPYIVIIGGSKAVRDHYRVAHKRQATESDYDSFWGAIASIAARYTFPVLTVPNHRRFVQVVSKIFNSHRVGKAGQPRQLKVSPTNKYTLPARILALMPGLNFKAQTIVDTLDLTDPREIWTLTFDELKTVKGIADTLAGNIIDYFGI